MGNWPSSSFEVEGRYDRGGSPTPAAGDGSVVNVNGRMAGIRWNVRHAPALPEGTREGLERVLGELATQVQSVSDRLPAGSERILEGLERLSRELGQKKPSRHALSVTWEGLKEAMGVVADAVPAVVGLSKKLAGLLALVPL